MHFVRQNSKEKSGICSKLPVSRQDSRREQRGISSNFSFSRQNSDTSSTSSVSRQNSGISSKMSISSQNSWDQSRISSKFSLSRQNSTDQSGIFSKLSLSRENSMDQGGISSPLSVSRQNSRDHSAISLKLSMSRQNSREQCGIPPKVSVSRQNSREQHELLWESLSLSCVKVLQLYLKVFDRDWKDLARYLIKNCKNCKCPRDSHAISEFAARSRIGFNTSNDSLDARNVGYTFVPSGLTKAHQVAQFYSLFPNHEVPKIGSQGEETRSQRLVKQLPKQDLSLAACKFVESNHRGSYQDFVTARNEIALDIGFVKPSSNSAICENCTQPIPNGQFCVSTMKMGDSAWHPSCFRCATCDDLLVDLAYCVHKDKIYCERHYAECLKPRCEGCDEVPVDLITLTTQRIGIRYSRLLYISSYAPYSSNIPSRFGLKIDTLVLLVSFVVPTLFLESFSWVLLVFFVHGICSFWCSLFGIPSIIDSSTCKQNFIKILLRSLLFFPNSPVFQNT
ncbi:hypothetical protein HHI36_005981 [Cryptolaemus montrouzieri]|uniref:Uncharacterized protein n=1 Tax=Cryptolaemus montrouzieri TaxID=559131 RepID=A0ABD2NVN7_9CUCU